MDWLHIALGLLLGLVFVAAGLTKVIGKREALLPRMAWMADFSPAIVRFIGVAEAIGGVALLMSAIANWLAIGVIAGVCLAVTMVLAIIVHLRRREPREIIPAALLLVLLVIDISLGVSGSIG